MSVKPVPVDPKLVESSERSKDVVCKSKERPIKLRKEQSANEKMLERTKVTAEATQVRETQQVESPRDKRDFKSETSGEVLKIREIPKIELAKNKKCIEKPETQKLETFAEALKMRGTQKMESPKDAKDTKDVKPSISAKIPEEKSVEDENASKPKIIPVLERVSFSLSHENVKLWIK
jgi:hypothetical protein